ncbi:MAG: MetQ/NlpA family ABC transporter substrate-binding protein [Commensalibacter sp.]|nr:MetQ/NlpA family ABC transporter substrate-binding protein [Commensalibacter sp.]
MMIFSHRAFLASLTAFILYSGIPQETKAASTVQTIRVGIISGPEEELALTAKEVAKTKNIDIQLVNFDDYNIPNEALVGKDIDANAFQTVPFMDAQIQARNYKLAVLGKTWAEPLGFYSHKIKSIRDLPDQAKIAIPNDPSNQGRALNLLMKANLIQLRQNAPALPRLGDVISNPHHFQLIDLDAAQLSRALDDVTMAAVNTNFVIPAGINPKSALLREDIKDSPYDNILVVRKGDENRPEMKLLLESFQSDAVKKAMEDKFHGAILPAW